MSAPVLQIEDLHVHFRTHAGIVHAVNGMTFAVQRGEIFGLVGESGCGKSVTGMATLNMVKSPGSIISGRIRLSGEDLVGKTDAEMMSIRGRRIAMIFQDPTASLNPVFTIGAQISSLVRLHRGASKGEAFEHSAETLASVGLPEPEKIMHSYPHELSGGMQQRAMIAMALACGAELLIADEPTTALDVTIQSQILHLLEELRARQGVAILLITHDLGIVAEVCDRVAVAYAGRVVEIGTTAEILNNPLHPYTRALLASLPENSSRDRPLPVIEGRLPDGLAPIVGCPFRDRCSKAMEICGSTTPPWVQEGDTQSVACHLYPISGAS